jgi:putative heme transporter
VGTTAAPAPPRRRSSPGFPRLRSAGQAAWALVGIILAVAALVLVVRQLRLLVVPFVLALFAAAVLQPVYERLRRLRFPPAAAALAALLALLAAIGGVVAVLVPLVADELPALTDALVEGVRTVDQFLRERPFGLQLGGLSDVLQRGFDQAMDNGAMGEALATAGSVVMFGAGTVLVLVATFFYLKDGHRFRSSLLTLLPARYRPDAREMASRGWETLGQYLRGQLIVAVFDAVLIGLGLVLLGVPMAIPLAALVLVGGLFPIIGAIVSGALAVLVALAHGGLGLGLAVLAVVVAVQQVESNVLQPYVQGRIVRLHPFVVVASVTAGAVLLGVLGAFLAVPAAATAARCIEYLRTERRSNCAGEPGRTGVSMRPSG